MINTSTIDGVRHLSCQHVQTCDVVVFSDTFECGSNVITTHQSQTSFSSTQLMEPMVDMNATTFFTTCQIDSQLVFELLAFRILFVCRLYQYPGLFLSLFDFELLESKQVNLLLPKWFQVIKSGLNQHQWH